MATRTKEEHEMYKALNLVRALAAKRVNEAEQAEVGSKILTRAYLQREIEKAQVVDNWCFLQQMRIDPD